MIGGEIDIRDKHEIESLLLVEFENMSQLIPEELREEFNKNAYICGGAIYSLRNDKEPKDYDFFIRDKAFAEKLLTLFKAQDVKPFKNFLQGKYKGNHLMISKYAISIGKYQIVIKYIGEPADVIEQFDFKHNMYAYYRGQIHSFIGWEQWDSNNLEFNDLRVRDICGTLLRINKFTKRGMTISKREQAKILQKLCDNGFDDAEKEILKDCTTY